MIYETPDDWTRAGHRRVALFGMSGLGKTRIAAMLREQADWFHYSVDFRIGTRYMGEHIVDNFKREAMRTPFLRELLRSDSIYIASNITFHNLEPLSTYLGKPGDPAKGGIPFDEYLRRQRQHRGAEIAATRDAVPFIAKAEDIYGYSHFACDTSGSLCEVVDPYDPADPVLADLAGSTLPIWFRGTEEHLDELSERFDRAPKPMYYPEEFLSRTLDRLLRGQRPRPRRSRSRRLHPPRVPGTDGAPPATLPGDRRALGRGRRGHRRRHRPRPAGLRRPRHGGAAPPSGRGPAMSHDHYHHGHHHDHDHGAVPRDAASARAVGIAALLTGGFMVAEVIGGVVSGSLALLADAGHMLTDFAALAMAWLAFRVARRPADRKRTYGFDRLSVLAAFVNGLALFAIAIWITAEAAHRLGDPQPVAGGIMLAVAAAGLATNVIAFLVLSGGDRGNLNLRAALLHVAADLLGSLAAMVAAIVILWTGWTPIDPILSVFVSVLILFSAWRVVRDSAHILLEGTPSGFDAGAIVDDLRASVPGVTAVRHLHAWSITEARPMVTLEAVVALGADPDAARRRIKTRLAERFGFDHATVETCVEADHERLPAAASRHI